MNKNSFDWKNPLIELLIVFIGIYGAFALNNWNNSRQERDQEKKYLTNIYSEVLQDIESLINNT